MKVRIGQDDVLALDCVQPLGGGHVFVQGWLSWPRGTATPVLGLRAGDLPLESLAHVLYDRSDLTGAMDDGRNSRGFILVAGPPAGTRLAGEFHFTVGTDEVAMPATRLGAPVAELLARQPWGAVFDLIAAAAADSRLRTLLVPEGGGAGALDRWIASVPRLATPVENQGGLAHVEAAATALGECVVAVTLPRPLGPQEELRVVALAEDRDRRLPVRLEGPPPLRAEHGVRLYGRLPAGSGLPVASFDLLVGLQHPGGGAWFRTAPRLIPAPAFLAALQHPHGDGNAADGFAWLHGVLEMRRAAFDVAFHAALASCAPRGMPGEAPVVAVLHDMDDRFAARLVFLAAAEIERRAAEVVVVGAPGPAAEVADVFLQRGRIPVRVGLDLPGAVRRGTYARARLVPIEPAALAEALETGGLDALFARGIDGAALAPVLRLAGAAGSLDGGDAIARLARLLAGLEGGSGLRHRGMPLVGAAGHLVTEHLAALWRDAAPALRARASHEPR
ncbi:hypothetical protein KPL78_02325 [Roseomonas sp. HJA6]|uniref:Uncharacterized protein n=1 Tax=Roseomonas alba TaxID=2846776 RepID=A0ABS7A2Z0_9PROT|nr:hypothetical protein [Neoroseomonas alba]MBW6396661.1 hypothetical protein [Neoroseomonas alba]